MHHSGWKLKSLAPWCLAFRQSTLACNGVERPLSGILKPTFHEWRIFLRLAWKKIQYLQVFIHELPESGLSDMFKVQFDTTDVRTNKIKDEDRASHDSSWTQCRYLESGAIRHWEASFFSISFSKSHPQIPTNTPSSASATPAVSSPVHLPDQ
jgi:hypothetical protein